MVKRKKIVIDSDVVADHLTTEEPISVLRRLMRQYFCYTTVFNAAELFAAARTHSEGMAVENALHAMKILGLNGKSAKNIAPLLRTSRTEMAGLIAGICSESRLPIVTMRPERYAGIRKIEVIHTESLLQ